ncbi:hypothetical protein CLV65_0490 [Pseudoscardovia suis]|uniref:Uncharacterized protein n=1 Tax=Pseudoscardovia suis TaxID=987063 RepID=A0A261ES38_9BIFI|nr:hypothetical protein PSSU_1479 [Pseudoscardovia suis]PJJ69774.1 hypothetical protein CLV65_0490 [Pseudoscardovia suis]
MFPRQQISLLSPLQHRPIPIGGHTNVHPRRGSHPPTPPQQHPTHIEGTLQRTLDAGCPAAGARRSSPAPAHHRTAPVPPHICATQVCPRPALHRWGTLHRSTAQAGRTETRQPRILACKRALHCAMYTVKRPDNLGAVRTITRHGELDKEFSQSPDTAEPQSRQRPAKAKTRASRAPGQPRPRPQSDPSQSQGQSP